MRRQRGHALPARPLTHPAVIFDCDGVLFDSWRANVAYYNAVLVALERPPLDATWERRVHFLASSQVLAELFGADPAAFARAQQIARGIDYEPFYALMEPVAGLQAVLGELKRSHRLAMASNRGSTVREVARRFGLLPYFDAVVGVLDVPRPKPHPDMIIKCLADLGADPARTVYVGDAESDLAAATAAGVGFVAVGDVAWAPRRIGHLRELPAFLAYYEP